MLDEKIDAEKAASANEKIILKKCLVTVGNEKIVAYTFGLLVCYPGVEKKN